MPAERRFGMDHEHYDWSPLSTRGTLDGRKEGTTGAYLWL